MTHLRRTAVICSTLLALVLVSASCRGSAARSSADPVATDPVEVVTTTAPTTTTPTTEAPTTVPPTTAPRSTTTTLDEATRNFYERFGGPRVDPAVNPGPTAEVSELRCFAVIGKAGFGAHAVVTWSDGVVETLDSPGTYTVTTKAVAVGSRGTMLDVEVVGDGACGPGLRFAGEP